MKAARLFSLLLLVSFALGKNMTLIMLKDYPLGSMCIDGSPSGYYYRAGAETTKWIVHHEGGGWCTNTTTCGPRVLNAFGSSNYWVTSQFFDGILSDYEPYNPDFYNWTMVFMAYCDGSSFSSSVTEPIRYLNQTLYYRGKNNLDATIADLLNNKDLDKATEVIITGCSAGGLSTYIHLDYWASRLPEGTKVRGIADAGWFLDTKSYNGNSTYTPRMQGGWAVWNASGGVNDDCIAHYTATNETWKCIFAEYTYPFIKTPIFVYNSKYDSYQVPSIFDLPCGDNLTTCNATEYQQFLGYGETFLSTLPPVEDSLVNSLYIDACYVHCQSLGSWWTDVVQVTPDGTKLSAATAFANWYYGRSESRAVQTCTYPCNPSCF